MLSALVLLHGAEAAPPEAIVRTLTALVPAAVEGVVRDLALCAPRPRAACARAAAAASAPPDPDPDPYPSTSSGAPVRGESFVERRKAPDMAISGEKGRSAPDNPAIE